MKVVTATDENKFITYCKRYKTVLPFGDPARNGLSSSVPRHFGSVVATGVDHFAHDLQGAAGFVKNVTITSGYVTGTGHRHAYRRHCGQTDNPKT